MTISKRNVFKTIVLSFVLSSCSVFSNQASSKSDITQSEPLSSTSESEIVADFRERKTQIKANGLHATQNETNETDSAKAIVEAAMGSGAFERYRLADTVQGHFTSTEQQSLHVIVNRKVTAVAKEVTPSILFIFQDNKPVTQFVLSKASYLAVVSIYDVDNDGLNEVLLSATAFQMGTQFVNADVYSFANASDILKQEMGVVYSNNCDSTITVVKEIRASVLSITPAIDELVTESYVAPCKSGNESPDIDLFTKAP